MSRVFWDTMLLIYFLEEHPQHGSRVEALLSRSYQRGDSLCTSYLALGELMAGARSGTTLQRRLEEMGFRFLAFDEGAVSTFSRLRSIEKVRIADAIHLACAASAGIDLFLTGDKQLQKLNVSGIQFIADFHNPIL